jgi:hypothetical protein
MGDMAEDRVYDERAGSDTVLLATGTGVVAVAVSASRVGRFGLDHRCVARDVTADAGVVAVATSEDVLVRPADDSLSPTSDASPEGGGYARTGFGEAAAVGVDGGAVLAADPDEDRVYRLLADDVEGGGPGGDTASSAGGPSGDTASSAGGPSGEDHEWLEVGDVDHPVRRIDGNLLAAGDGVYRVTPDGLHAAGLDDARDVAAGGPYAATGDGLYRLANGWVDDLSAPTDAVAAVGPGEDGPGDVSAIADADGVHLRRDGNWERDEAPRDPVDVGLGRAVYAVTADGAFLHHDGEGWRTRSLGLPTVRAMAVVGGN